MLDLTGLNETHETTRYYHQYYLEGEDNSFGMFVMNCANLLTYIITDTKRLEVKRE